MEESLGIVISTPETPNTTMFDFAIKSSHVQKGEFVQVKSPSGPVLGSVSEIVRANRYFERAESVAEYSNQMAHFPTDEWEYSIAKVRVHGVLDKMKLSRASTPVKCGLHVFKAETQQLKSFLKIDDSGLEIGKLRHHELDVKINLSKLFQKHLAILAMSGSGKSYLAGVLMEELLERKENLSKIAIIVIDNHGEYTGFENSIYKDKTTVIDGTKIKIGLKNLSSSKLFEWSSSSKSARRIINNQLKDLKIKAKKSGESFSLRDLSDAIASDESIKENVRAPLLGSIDELESFRLISKTDTIKSSLVKPANLIVFDLSKIDDSRKKQMIVSHYAHKFFHKRKKGKIPPFLLVVEEAHNFCPERMDKTNALSRPIINTIAREGRKFGASLCLISQRPVQLSTTALSQCNSTIILRITNPYDLKHIGESCEGIDSDSLKSITTLKVGEALIMGEAVGAPIFVDVRKRRSNIKEAGQTLDELAIEYEKKLLEQNEQIEAYL
jgi:hypothetical protein